MTKPLVARTSSWWRLGIVLSILFTFQGAGAYLAGIPGLVAATLIYFLLKWFLQRRAKAFQKLGLKLLEDERYLEAASTFEAGYQYFTDRRWMDRYRAISMFDHTAMDWREIMLANMAASLALAGEREQAIELYRRCLQLYPESRLAKLPLRLLTVGEGK